MMWVNLWSVALAIFSLGCSANHVIADDQLLNTAASAFHELNYQTKKALLGENITFEETRRATTLKSVLDAPLTNTKFYLYELRSIEPANYVIVYQSNDKIDKLELSYQAKEPICASVIDKFNDFLESEKSLNQKELFQLVELMLDIKYPGRDGIHILNNWNDISHDEKRTVPLNIQKLIKPPEIAEDSAEITISVFCWDVFSRYVSKVAINYDGKRISFQIHSLGEFGVGRIIL